jgi:hypothetical protein
VVTYLLANFDCVSSPTGKKNTVSRLHVHRNEFAILVTGAWANGDDGSLRKGTIRSGARQKDARSSFLLSKPLAYICMKRTDRYGLSQA